MALVLNGSGRRVGAFTCQIRAGRNEVQLLTFSHFLHWHRHPVTGRGGHREREERLEQRARNKGIETRWNLLRTLDIKLKVLWYGNIPPKPCPNFFRILENDSHLRGKAFLKAKFISPNWLQLSSHTKTSLRYKLVMGGIFYGTKYLFLLLLWGYLDRKWSLEEILPVKDILRSKFTWHIKQLTNNRNHEILFWSTDFSFFLINLALCLLQNICATMTLWSFTVKTWNL